MTDVVELTGEDKIEGLVAMKEIKSNRDFDPFPNSNLSLQSDVAAMKLSYLTEALKRCGEIKRKTEELLHNREGRDAFEMKLDLKTKVLINKAFVELRRANREASLGRRDEKNFRTKAKDAFDEAQYRLLEVKYKEALLDHDLKIAKFKESEYQKISLISVEEFFVTAPNEFTDSLKSQNLVSSGDCASNSERQRYEHELLLQRLKYEKSEREILEDEKIRKLSRKRDLECIIEKKLSSAYLLDVILKEYIKKIDQCKSLKEVLRNWGSLPLSVAASDNNDIDSARLDCRDLFNAKACGMDCTVSDKEEGELI
ncbi:5830_t:CDS:2 [Acaulospora colombiana]|uniref:5830_t:CDS:1 n=1 Tax=Acaulospora colombiana TaxID=27376 RepID=A0ACA9KBV3_9GLOM|nr:5830_t:CDS:2 [Acaulospora colombiana]